MDIYSESFVFHFHDLLLSVFVVVTIITSKLCFVKKNRKRVVLFFCCDIISVRVYIKGKTES